MSDRISSSAGTRFERWPGVLRLAFGVLAGPLSALIMQTTAYNGVHWACGHSSIGPVHVVPGLFLLIGFVALWMAWSDWTAVGRVGRAEGATVSDRTRFV